MNILFVSDTSVCLELDNNSCYYANEPFEVVINGEKQEKKYKENVFSLFGLLPDCDYTVEAAGEKVTFRTERECSMCINVQKQGAVGDGKSEDTAVLQACIDACPSGGKIYVPKGVYKIAPLTLKSNITIEIAKGAVLCGVTEVEKYPVRAATAISEDGTAYIKETFEGEVLPCRASLLHGYGVTNVRIIGQGTIDGNAQSSTWWTKEYKNRSIGRPRLVFLNGCKNILFHGITVQNAAAWTIHPFLCENVSFYDVSIYSPATDAPNTDGIDPDCCNGVNIVGCRLSTGDDCIAIKSGKRELAEQLKTVADKHTIRNCLMERGHGAVVLGSEIGCGVRELSVTQCMFDQTEKGLRIKTRRGRGKLSVIDGVVFENLKMNGVITPFVINMYYNCGAGGKTEYVWSREMREVDDDTPFVGSVTFRNIECKNCICMAGYFDGLVESPIKRVEIENVSFHFKMDAELCTPATLSFVKAYSRGGLYFDNVEGIIIKNVHFENVDGEEIILKNYSSYQRI